MKTSHIILIGLIAVCVGFIISTLGDASTYVTFAQAEENLGETYTVIGEINLEKEISYDPTKNQLTFFAVDSLKNERKVIHGGPKPQDFERAEKVTMTGYAKEEYFVAQKILMKCPSKYNGENISESTAELSTSSN